MVTRCAQASCAAWFPRSSCLSLPGCWDTGPFSEGHSGLCEVLSSALVFSTPTLVLHCFGGTHKPEVALTLPGGLPGRHLEGTDTCLECPRLYSLALQVSDSYSRSEERARRSAGKSAPVVLAAEAGGCLNPGPNSHKPCRAVHNCHPSTQEAVAGRSGVQLV